MLYDIESIRIDGQDYEVQWHDRPIMPVDTEAFVNYNNQIIAIYKSHEQNDLNSLLHEIIHVINHNRLGNKLEEHEVNNLGCAFTQLISDNMAEIMAMASIGLDDDDSDESELEL